MKCPKLSLDLTRETRRELEYLADALGFEPELAAVYAIRLVSACVREGLIADVPARAWPKEAAPLYATGAQGKVISLTQRQRGAEE